MFAILQKYDFSSKSQLVIKTNEPLASCLRYCKSTIFQANHNCFAPRCAPVRVVCDTAKVRFFKQITTNKLAIILICMLFAILQKYDFSSKSQPLTLNELGVLSCLRYCKSTIFQANHNYSAPIRFRLDVVCDTAKVRFFKQITTAAILGNEQPQLFAILQKYDFSSKSQLNEDKYIDTDSCLRYCKSTIFQANHNFLRLLLLVHPVVCDTAKVRFFKQITTLSSNAFKLPPLFAILQKYDFSSKSQRAVTSSLTRPGCLRYCKSTIFQANHN